LPNLLLKGCKIPQRQLGIFLPLFTTKLPVRLGDEKIDSSIICYAGISFYKSRDRSTTQISISQIFDELGKGVILRGEDPVITRRDDPVPHMSGEQAFKLLDTALEEYRQAVKIALQRMVVHKTSHYNTAEMEGLDQASKKHQIHSLDLVKYPRFN
jgi:hypothetical protein